MIISILWSLFFFFGCNSNLATLATLTEVIKMSKKRYFFQVMTNFEQILWCLHIHTHTPQIYIMNTSFAQFNCNDNIVTSSLDSTMNLNSPWSQQAQCRLKTNFHQALQYVPWKFKSILNSGFLGLPNATPLLCRHWCLYNCVDWSAGLADLKLSLQKRIAGDISEIKFSSFRPVAMTSQKCWEPVSLKIRPKQRKNSSKAGYISKYH